MCFDCELLFDCCDISPEDVSVDIESTLSHFFLGTPFFVKSISREFCYDSTFIFTFRVENYREATSREFTMLDDAIEYVRNMHGSKWLHII